MNACYFGLFYIVLCLIIYILYICIYIESLSMSLRMYVGLVCDWLRTKK